MEMVTKYYQKHKERLKKKKKKHTKDSKFILKKKKTEGEEKPEIDSKIFLKNKSGNYLSI